MSETKAQRELGVLPREAKDTTPPATRLPTKARELLERAENKLSLGSWKGTHDCAAEIRNYLATCESESDKANELEATLDDEEVAHLETLDMLAAAQQRIAELEAMIPPPLTKQELEGLAKASAENYAKDQRIAELDALLADAKAVAVRIGQQPLAEQSGAGDAGMLSHASPNASKDTPAHAARFELTEAQNRIVMETSERTPWALALQHTIRQIERLYRLREVEEWQK